jgi:hypothetical protein
MSGGGGGRIIINRIADSDPVTVYDRCALHAIADRSSVRCSLLDAVRVLAIIWKYIRG